MVGKRSVKFIQIATDAERLNALDDEGRVWERVWDAPNEHPHWRIIEGDDDRSLDGEPR